MLSLLVLPVTLPRPRLADRDTISPTTSWNLVDRVEQNQPRSSSTRKIESKLVRYDSFVEDPFRYNIVNLNIAKEMMKEMCVCKVCGGSVEIFAKRINGLVTNIHIMCETCKLDKYKSEKVNYKPDYSSVPVSVHDMNIRLLYALRSIGKGECEAQTFCGIMNLPSPPTSYSKIIKLLGAAAERVCRDSMRDAVEEGVGLITVTGIYMRRSMVHGKNVDIHLSMEWLQQPALSQAKLLITKL